MKKRLRITFFRGNATENAVLFSFRMRSLILLGFFLGAFSIAGILFVKEGDRLIKAVSGRSHNLRIQNQEVAELIQKIHAHDIVVPSCEDDSSFQQKNEQIVQELTSEVSENLLDKMSLSGLVFYTDSLAEYFQHIAERSVSVQSIWRRFPLVLPVSEHEEWVVERSFGVQTDPFSGETKQHRGIDVAAVNGTPVLAPADGEVINITTDRFWGKLIHLRHSEGYETKYAHLAHYTVRRGEQVSRGDTIGVIGESGWSSGSHLHYEILKNGKHVDPNKYRFISLSH